MEQHSFGHWLRLKRKALDLTREQLAERVGYSAATIRKIEDEERHPSAQVVERLAEVFNIPQDDRINFSRFARGDLNSAPSQSVENRPWRVSRRSTPSNLPATTTSLIGREKEIRDVYDYLIGENIRLVTLTGPPGIGKTRLSIEAARQSLPDFPDGVFFVSLAPLNDPTLIAVTLAQALGYVGASMISTSEQLKEGIGDKHMLIVLDNCEHRIEDVALLSSELLLSCSQLKILATSRESLRISGEWLYAVPAFDIPRENSSIDMESASNFPILTLFAERARAVKPDFVLNDENIKTVSSICAHLDGLPLAIELIAARIRLMSPEALLARMNNQFILTADGMRAASERQKTLHNAIDWSHNLLSPEEQRLFAYLSVFSGGFTLEAVEAMFSRKMTEKSLPNLIALLLDKSLLKFAPDLEASGGARHTMLVTIQEFARERLREMGQQTEVRDWHLAHFLDLAERADKELRGHHQREWLRRLDSDRDNLRAALDWAIETGQTKMALQMARKLHWFFFVSGDHTEGQQWLRRALKMTDASLYPEAQAEALTQLAHHIWLIIRTTKEARASVEQAVAIAHAHNDQHNIAKALAILGLILTRENDFVTAQSTLEESKALFQEIGDKWGFAHAIMCLGLQSLIEDDRETSLALHEQALALFREVGDRYFQCAALRQIGNLRVKQGDLTHGTVALQEALILAQDLNSKYEIYAVIWSMGEAAQRGGNPERALKLYWTAKNIAESVGTWWKEDEVEFEAFFAACRAALSASAFEEVVKQGRAMTMEQAVAFVLEKRDA
jgi:predicted ATPase/transcriptional regulator with XRE-family HTH domain